MVRKPALKASSVLAKVLTLRFLSAELRQLPLKLILGALLGGMVDGVAAQLGHGGTGLLQKVFSVSLLGEVQEDLTVGHISHELPGGFMVTRLVRH